MAKKKRNGNSDKRQSTQQQPPPEPIPPATTTPAAKIQDEIKPPVTERATRGEDNSDTEELTQAVDRSVRWNTFFTFAIMAAAVVQAVVSWFQWSAMERGLSQTDATIEQMRLEQRPWLSVKLPGPPPMIAGKFVDLTLSVKNNGHSPARILGSITSGVYTDRAEDVKDDFDESRRIISEDANSGFVAPGAEIEFAGENFAPPEPVTEEVIAAVNSKEMLLFISAIVNYADLNGEKHTTRACFVYNPEAKRFQHYAEYSHMD